MKKDMLTKKSNSEDSGSRLMALSPRMLRSSSSPRMLRSPSRSRPNSGEFPISDINKKNFRPLEQKMDVEVERMFRNWDANLQKRDNAFSLKPLRTSKSHNRLSPCTYFSDFDKETLDIERCHSRENLSGSGDDISNHSSESIDEESKKPLYVICPQTGKRMIKMQFDVTGFHSRDLKIKLSGRKLIIYAVHKVTDSGRKSTTEFCRKIKLPDDVDLDKIVCSFTPALITIEAPVKMIDYSNLKQRLNVTNLEKVNTPIVRHTDNGRMLYIFVELGRIFKPEDVVVKLKGHDKLVINANRNEENETDTLIACVTREFQLPERIYPHSLKAGLSQDGILNTTALIQDSQPEKEDNSEAEISEKIASEKIASEKIHSDKIHSDKIHSEKNHSEEKISEENHCQT